MRTEWKEDATSNPKVAESHSGKGKDATEFVPTGADVDVRKDLLEILADARSSFVKIALQTYKFVESLALDHLKLVESLHVVELSKDANDFMVDCSSEG